MASDSERFAVIEKAKQEWECTVDALPSVVCLVDSGGIVQRANRTVEKWGLGPVGNAIGRSAHSVLHPDCDGSSCPVARGLCEALPKMHEDQTREFECYSGATDQILQFTLRPMGNGEAHGAVERTARAVLVVTDVSSLRRAQHTLESINFYLESRVRLRTRELDDANRDLRSEVERRTQAESELLSSRNNLALLSEQLMQAQEGERRRIALELHDSVGQSLCAIKYAVERAAIMVKRPGLGSPESVLALAIDQIQATADGIRAISTNLRPKLLDDMGAASATSWFCRSFAEIYPSMSVNTEVSAENEEIPPRIATHLFRCVQELLNNAAKHSQAANVWLTLSRDESQLLLLVRDDGIGMPLAADAARMNGSGLRNLRERAEMTGGQFSIASQPSGGTLAQIIWWLDADAS